MRLGMDRKKILGWLIIIIMSLSILGYIGGGLLGLDTQSVSKKDYNGFTFTNQQGQWQMQYQGQAFIFQYFPTELENISVPPIANSLLFADSSSTKLYVAYVPNDTLALDQSILRVRTLLLATSVLPQTACVRELGCPDIPVLNCAENKGIIFRSAPTSGFSTEEKCLVLQAQDYNDVDKLTERLLYTLMGVMN